MRNQSISVFGDYEPYTLTMMVAFFTPVALWGLSLMLFALTPDSRSTHVKAARVGSALLPSRF